MGKPTINEGKFVPVGENHSITNMVVTLGVREAWNEDIGGLLDNNAYRWRELMPQKTVVEQGPTIRIQAASGGEVAIGPSANAQSPPQGRVFTGYQKDGEPEWQMQIQPHLVVLMTGTYNGWNSTGQLANRILEQLGGSFADRRIGIGSVELTFVDQFLWKGSGQKYDTSKLLAEENEWIPGRVWQQRGPWWHCHQGYLRERDAEKAAELRNVELTGVLDENGQCRIIMKTTVKRGHGENVELLQLQRDFRHLHSAGKSGSKGWTTLDELHSDVKEMFKEMLCKEAQEAVGLTREE